MSAERCVVMVGPALHSRGGIASVCAEYERSGMMRRLNVRYLDSFVSAGKLAKLRVAARALVKFAGLLLIRRVDILHVHMATGASTWRKLVFCVLALVFRVPYVVHLHSGKFPEFFTQRCNAMSRGLIRQLLRRSAWVIVLSSERLQWLAAQGFRRDRTSVLPNMVELHVTAAYDDRSRSLLFLGRLEEAKGLSTLLDAFALVHAQDPAVKLLLGGEGDRSRYVAQARQLGVEHAVQFLGWVDASKKRKLMEDSAAFVLPSLYEGLPMGLLEAMSYGIPCVATPVGGVPDIIQDGVNGLLVPVEDPDALAEALLRLLGSSMLRAQLADAGRSTVSRSYCLDAVENQLRMVYDDLLNRPAC